MLFFASGGVVFADTVDGGKSASRVSRGQDPGIFRFLGVHAEAHDVRVFVRIIVMAAEYEDRLKAHALEEELGSEVAFAHLKHNFLPALLAEFVHELFNQLRADGLPSELRIDREV